MATQKESGISWLLALKNFTGETWNCQRGCSREDAGCGGGTPEAGLKGGCYAEAQAIRGAGPGGPYEGLVENTAAGVRWTGKTLLVREKLGDPLRWESPRLVFTDSMSDTFHKGFKMEEIAAVFGVMAASPNHIFQVLTKRHARAEEFMAWVESQGGPEVCIKAACELLPDDKDRPRLIKKLLHAGKQGLRWPAPNVELVFSCATQAILEKRLPVLVRIPAAIRGISAEPLLGPLDFYRALWGEEFSWERVQAGLVRPPKSLFEAGLHGIITGGESGHEARPAREDWFTSARVQMKHPGCGGVAFHHKQHGVWTPGGSGEGLYVAPSGRWWSEEGQVPAELRGSVVYLRRHPNKHEAGRLLEGKLWDEYPQAFHALADEILARVKPRARGNHGTGSGEHEDGPAA